MYNFLFCSAGRRVKLIKDFKETIGENGKIIVADNSIYAPTRYEADKAYTVPEINNNDYINNIVDICKKENINVVLTLIDPEIEILSKNKKIFDEMGIMLLVPSKETAKLCFDKYEMYKYLKNNNIKTVQTYEKIDEFENDYKENKIKFPVFVKPRTGSGSVGARKVSDLTELKNILSKEDSMIIQEFMEAEDLDADVYVDVISKKIVSIFAKKKIETKIGGASKTVSFKDKKLFQFISEILEKFDFSGPIDMDFFYKDNQYYLSEINPRFGGAYIHAYGMGINFPKFIINNIKKIENKQEIGNYDEDIVMLMYDDIILKKI